MPLLNKTGPMGLGPYTGRGYGTCGGNLATVGDSGASGVKKLAGPVGLGVVGGVLGWFFRGTLGAGIGVVAGLIAGSILSKKSGEWDDSFIPAGSTEAVTTVDYYVDTTLLPQGQTTDVDVEGGRGII